MNRNCLFTTLIAAALAWTGMMLAACSCEGTESGDAPEPENKPSRIVNGNFEDGLEGWTITGDESSVALASDGCYGSGALAISSDKAANITVSQKLTDVADGFYDLVFFAKDSQNDHTAYVEANGRRTALDWSSSAWKKFYVKGIEVSGGELDISIHLNSDGSAQCEFDGMNLLDGTSGQIFIKGGDISELSYVEQNGGRYFYADGTQAPCLDILRDNGMNLARLRLYNDPGNADHEPSRLMPKGIQDAEDVLSLAARASEKGMQILLTFHYSDYWTNGEDQYIPHEWAGLDIESLKTAVYEYTRDFLERMALQGTSPEYVAIGNEIQAGLLYPLGFCKKEDGSSNEVNMCALLSAASKGVREAAPDSRIILHLTAAGDRDLYDWFLSLMKNHGVDYDIIGASYYPFWTGRDVETVSEWAEYVTDKFDKDLIYMETGYAWNPSLPDGSTGQIAHNKPYADMTRAGQKSFLLSLCNGIRSVENRRVLGFVYWDPIFIETPSRTGWIVGEKNCVSNSTLFDFGGTALESFDAFRYND